MKGKFLGQLVNQKFVVHAIAVGCKYIGHPNIGVRNKNGNEVKIASNNTNGTFNFSLLGIEKTSMSDLIIEDVTNDADELSGTRVKIILPFLKSEEYE